MNNSQTIHQVLLDGITLSNNNSQVSRITESSNLLFSTSERDVCFPSNHEDKGVDLKILQEFFESQESTSIKDNSNKRFMFYSKQTGEVSATNFQNFSSLEPNFSEALQSEIFWLDVTSPTEAEMRTLSRIFHIHPLTVEDILTEESREKCEVFKQYYFVCFRAYEQKFSSVSYLDPLNVYNVVFKNGIISFHFKPLYHTASVLKRIDHLRGHITASPDWINYALIDSVTDSFAPILRDIEFEVDAIDELVLILKESDQGAMLKRIGHTRRKVTLLIRLLNSKPDVLKALLLRYNNWAKPSQTYNIKLYLGDIQDHLITMTQNILHYEKVLARAHSNYLAQISIELTQVASCTNHIVAKLTVIASIFLPMNVITSLWGVNVHVPGQNKKGDGYEWFIGICMVMVLIAAVSFFCARRSKLF